MVRISPDVGRNRVIIQLSGTPSSAQLTLGEQALHQALARLRPPVDVLNDIRELEAVEPHVAGDLRRCGEVLQRFGVRKVVRVVGKSAQAAVHVERISRQLKSQAAHLAFSLEEAEQVFSR